MKKFLSGHIGLFLFLFVFMSILVFLEYEDYKKSFGKNILKKETMTSFKEIKVKKEVSSALTKMSKSAGRDLVELKVRYGYLKEEERKILGTNYEEFSTGLLVEFYSKSESERKKMQDWLEKNAYKYGFILRYPENKKSILRKSSDTIYRYVGKEASNEMHENDFCYEEYLERE